MKTIIIKTISSFNASLRIFIMILSVLACLAFLPQMHAAPEVAPPPDGCYPGFTTAEGCNALLSLTTGIANTGVGWFALSTNTDGSFNTGVGAGALDVNNGNENTAVGTGALLLNTTGANNTAVGAFALINNTDGTGSTAIGNRALQDQTSPGSNTATGFHAMIANTTGLNNAAYGVRPLESNVDGGNNTAIGNLALDSSVSTSNHVAVGRLAGASITTANNNIIVGHHNGVHSRFGQESDRCYIGNIYGANVNNAAGIARFVYVDPDGRLGTILVADGPNPGGSSPEGVQPEAIPDAQAMLNRKVEALEATVAELRGQLKEQAAQIQKVSVQLQLSRSAARTVAIDQ
jgi:hypothetical protein